MLLIWLNTREGFYEDIQQKMLISSIMYLLDDGPETLLQYYFVDKFSGTDYSYPDGFKTSFKTAILASSIVTFGLAFFSFIRLTLRYKDLILQQKRDGIKFKKAEIILLAKYFFVTVIPLAISCLRVFAAMYQLDTRRSYLPGCLEYSVEQSANNRFKKYHYSFVSYKNLKPHRDSKSAGTLQIRLLDWNRLLSCFWKFFWNVYEFTVHYLVLSELGKK